MVKHILSISLLLFGLHANAQYAGGNGDGFASISLAINTNIETFETPVIQVNGRQLVLPKQKKYEVVVYDVRGRMLITSENKNVFVPGSDKMVLYQLKTTDNKLFTGKLWLGN